MTVPPKYGLQTYIGAGVILMGFGFVGAQLLAPPASTANSTQTVATRPAPRIIEINTKRDDIKHAESAKPLEQAPAPPTSQFVEPGPPPVSAAELKRKAQEEADQQTAEMPQEVINPPPKRTPSRQRYPKYDRHAVY